MRVVTFKSDYNADDGKRFSSGTQYEVDKATLTEVHILSEGVVYPIPNSYLDGILVRPNVTSRLTKDCEDCWSYVAQETGIDRQTAKMFLIKSMCGDFSILELAREFKLNAIKIAHIHIAFGEWTGYEALE